MSAVFTLAKMGVRGEVGGGVGGEVNVIAEDTSPRNPSLASDGVTTIVVPERRTTGANVLLNSHFKASGFPTTTPITTATVKVTIRGENNLLSSLPGQTPVVGVITDTAVNRLMLPPIGVTVRGRPVVLQNAARSVLGTNTVGVTLGPRSFLPGTLVKLPRGVPLPPPPRGHLPPPPRGS